MRCAHLADYPHYRPQLAAWCYHEWEHLYAGSTEAGFETEFAASRRDELPITLIALESEELLGTVSLILNDLPGREDLNPWLASLYVRPEHRGRQVGRFLIGEAEATFRRLAVPEAYLFTESAGGLFQKSGWEFFGSGDANKHDIGIFRKSFEKERRQA